ncbi:MAG TPA: hypothetical protein PKG82_12495 [Myxococcota bacterium]|nr:hypothetical protein [Myxococcota bacterium]
MSRRKSDKVDDLAIGLMDRHSHVPTGEEQLERYATMYLGRPVGYEHAVEVVEEAAPAEVFEPQFEQPIDIPVAAEMDAGVAASYEDVDNDYDRPGATVVFDAMDVPAADSDWDSNPADQVEPAPEPADASMEATMTFEAAELADAPQVEFDPEGENSTVMLDALDDQEDEGEGDAQPSEGGEAGGEGAARRRKKRRHR